MNYREYLMQMAQRGKVIKTGGTLRKMKKQKDQVFIVVVQLKK
jgi:hypothetical protein